MSIKSLLYTKRTDLENRKSQVPTSILLKRSRWSAAAGRCACYNHYYYYYVSADTEPKCQMIPFDIPGQLGVLISHTKVADTTTCPEGTSLVVHKSLIGGAIQNINSDMKPFWINMGVSKPDYKPTY